MTFDDLEMVFNWRNHPEIRRYMYTTHQIGFEEHKAWFERVSKDSNVELLIFEQSGIPMGFVNFNATSFSGVAEWGFYMSPIAEKGMGKRMGLEALKYGFNDRGLRKICGQALSFNKGSISFHKKLGFTEEGCLREQYYDGTNYHNIICFGLLKYQWEECVLSR